MKRLSKVEAADDPADGASEDEGTARNRTGDYLSNEEAEVASPTIWAGAPGPCFSTKAVHKNPFLFISALPC